MKLITFIRENNRNVISLGNVILRPPFIQIKSLRMFLCKISQPMKFSRIMIRKKIFTSNSIVKNYKIRERKNSYVNRASLGKLIETSIYNLSRTEYSPLK